MSGGLRVRNRKMSAHDNLTRYITKTVHVHTDNPTSRDCFETWQTLRQTWLGSFEILWKRLLSEITILKLPKKRYCTSECKLPTSDELMIWCYGSFSASPGQHTCTVLLHIHTVPGNIHIPCTVLLHMHIQPQATYIHTYSTVPHVRTVPGNIYMCSGGVVFGLEVAGYLAKKVSRGTFNTYIYRKGYSVFRIRTCTLWCASTTHNQPIITESKVVHYTFKAILSIPVLWQAIYWLQ